MGRHDLITLIYLDQMHLRVSDICNDITINIIIFLNIAKII